MTVTVSFSLLTNYFRFSNSPAPSSFFRSRHTSVRRLASLKPPIRMDASDDAESKRFMDFPHVTSPVRDLMVDLVSTVEDRLKSELLPCSLPNDVRFISNQHGTAENSLYIRSAIKPSKVDLILANWLHNKLSSGDSLNITTIAGYLSTLSDAPNFLIELIQNSPHSLIYVLDLPHRKDLILHPQYLHEYYEQTQLDKQRQRLLKVPEIQPFTSSSLHIRSLVSPTAMLVSIETGEGGGERMEEIIRETLTPVAKELLDLWLDKCAYGSDWVAEATEVDTLAARDRMVRIKGIEIDLASTYPKLFGEDISARLIEAIRVAYDL